MSGGGFTWMKVLLVSKDVGEEVANASLPHEAGMLENPVPWLAAMEPSRDTEAKCCWQAFADKKTRGGFSLQPESSLWGRSPELLFFFHVQGQPPLKAKRTEWQAQRTALAWPPAHHRGLRAGLEQRRLPGVALRIGDVHLHQRGPFQSVWGRDGEVPHQAQEVLRVDLRRRRGGGQCAGGLAHLGFGFGCRQCIITMLSNQGVTIHCNHLNQLFENQSVTSDKPKYWSAVQKFLPTVGKCI